MTMPFERLEDVKSRDADDNVTCEGESESVEPHQSRTQAPCLPTPPFPSQGTLSRNTSTMIHSMMSCIYFPALIYPSAFSIFNKIWIIVGLGFYFILFFHDLKKWERERTKTKQDLTFI